MINQYQKVLVTVGTTQFDQLIYSLSTPETISALSSIGCKQLIIQYGKFKDLDTLNLLKSLPNIVVELFDYAKSLENYIQQVDLVIGHAGAGTSLEVLRHGKPLLIVVNDQLMDNHQQELAQELAENNFAQFTDITNISKILRCFDKNNLKPFPKHDPNLFRNFIISLFKT